MAAGQVDRSWMWHPSFSEERRDTAGLFVHFWRTVHITDHELVPSALPLHVTADTRYKLYVNSRLVVFGPVKGDSSLWFYDEVDIAPFLKPGLNQIHVIVLRFFHGTRRAVSFPRLAVGGLRLVVPGDTGDWAGRLGSSSSWEAAIDPDTLLRVDEREDDFLHIYENTSRDPARSWRWLPAKVHNFLVSTGNSAPWTLSPRLIPLPARGRDNFSHLHNLRSSLDRAAWERLLLKGEGDALVLPAGSEHQLDLEMAVHTTAFIHYRFTRAGAEGSVLQVVYSEAYEDTPTFVPYLRRKGDRKDTTKTLLGPSDTYWLEGPRDTPRPGGEAEDEETYVPFHFRTFRFLRVTMKVGASDLALRGFQVEPVSYPLNVQARLECPDEDAKLWDTSIRTLRNCMHDCYEDCPFYEQLQYAMDTRSSILFTYRLAGDDRLARQAIIQLHNSFQPRLGLTASRAPSHTPQVIPNFSLFWVCMVADHYEYNGDAAFIAPFSPVIDAVLGYFESRVGQLGLVVNDTGSGIWNFTDWAETWRPHGIPPVVERTRISTYTNCLFAYALRHASTVVAALGRKALAREYLHRADRIVSAVRHHCFDGLFFADSIASSAEEVADYSQMAQAWAVLGGVVCGTDAEALMRRTLDPPLDRRLVTSSISMSFYTFRALSTAGGFVYSDLFHRSWDPWRAQLALNLTTWEEDDVSQRSDCHAWGSAPIYEFMAEVAGIRPGGPGWSSVVFAPRVWLYRTFRASCPMRMVNGELTGMAHVSWSEAESDEMEISLRFDTKQVKAIPVHIQVATQSGRVTDTSQEILLRVKKPKENAVNGK